MSAGHACRAISDHPREPLLPHRRRGPGLPLGDLWASQVVVLAGGWSAPLDIRGLAEAMGGIERLHAVLIAHFDERRDLSSVLERVPEPARGRLRDMLERARFARRRVGLIAKLGSRTAGIDLFG